MLSMLYSNVYGWNYHVPMAPLGLCPTIIVHFTYKVRFRDMELDVKYHKTRHHRLHIRNLFNQTSYKEALNSIGKLFQFYDVMNA